MTTSPQPGRLSTRDVLRLAGYGLGARPLRVFLSALGIAIGIAAMVGVVGTSTSSRAELDRLLDALGTNLLRVAPGSTLFGEQAVLPSESVAMIRRITAVESATAIGQLSDARVYRTNKIPPPQSGGIGTYAVRIDLLDTVGASVAAGTWLNDATAQYPAAVLGARTAERLGLGAVNRDVQIWIGGRWFTVIGILDPMQLAPELDLGALIGWQAAQRYLGFGGDITTLYTRTNPDAVEAARELLARTANPARPNEVEVSRPSDALAAQAAAETTFTGLLLGLGAVALLVGGIGVANTMVISVLERRAEIGLRRSLGATRGHIRIQFLAESLLLTVLGGVVGILLGSGVTAAYATAQGWPTVVPTWIVAGGIAVTVTIGAVAGLYPALRAARVSPTEALATAYPAPPGLSIGGEHSTTCQLGRLMNVYRLRGLTHKRTEPSAMFVGLAAYFFVQGGLAIVAALVGETISGLPWVTMLADPTLGAASLYQGAKAVALPVS